MHIKLLNIIGDGIRSLRGAGRDHYGDMEVLARRDRDDLRGLQPRARAGARWGSGRRPQPPRVGTVDGRL